MIPDKVIIYASSSSVYGLNSKLPFSTLDCVAHPVSLYAATKKSNELMAHSYSYLYGIPTTGLRFFTVYGPWGRPDMALFLFADKIMKGEPIQVFNRGQMKRDFTYVDDIARGTVAATGKVGYEIINLGGGRNPVSLNEVIERLEEMLGKKAKVQHKSFHKADLMETWAEIDKANKLLGWSPQVSLEDGLGLTVDWYLENREWAKELNL